MSTAAFITDGLPCPGKDLLDETVVGGGELVTATVFGELQTLGEGCVDFQVVTDVGTAALDEMSGKAGAGTVIDPIVVGHLRER